MAVYMCKLLYAGRDGLQVAGPAARRRRPSRAGHVRPACGWGRWHLQNHFGIGSVSGSMAVAEHSVPGNRHGFAGSAIKEIAAMKQAKLGTWIVLAAAMALSTVGCAQKEKDQIQQLTQRNNELDDQNKDLRDELAASKTREESLGMQLSAKQGELDTAGARCGTQNKPAAKRPRPRHPPPAGNAARWATWPPRQRYPLWRGQGDADAGGQEAAGQDRRRPQEDLPRQPVAGLRLYRHRSDQKSKELWQDNLDLSANRAMAVTRYLITKGINAKNIETCAMGENHPVASNKDTAGRTKNRRVEIVALKKE